MFSWDLELAGFKKVLVMAAAILIAVWHHDVITLLMTALAGYYVLESHRYYQSHKAYTALSGHLRNAAK